MYPSSTPCFSTCVAALLAIPLWQGALASPIHASSLYTLTAIGPDYNKSLTANGGGFYIGAGRVPCPQDVPLAYCPAEHETVVYIGNSTMQLETSSNRNRPVYIAPSGLLAFNEATNELGAGSLATGFSIQPSNQTGSAGDLIFKGNGARNWMACVDEDGGNLISRVYANVTGITDADVTDIWPTTLSQCVRIDIALTPNDGQNLIFEYPKRV